MNKELGNTKRILVFSSIVLFCVVAVFFTVIFSRQKTASTQSTPSVRIGSTTINVELAKTEPEWVQGLSGHAPLAQNTGMLFFDRDSQWQIWMKDMNFPLDILWVDTAGNIVYEKENVATSTYPEVFESPFPVRYVLEVPAGTIESDQIQPSDKMIISK